MNDTLNIDTYDLLGGLPLPGAKKVTVKFDDDIPSDIQGVVLLNLEKELRKLTGLDCRVYKDRMADDSSLRIVMDARRAK